MGWWISGVVNVWFYKGGGERLRWWTSKVVNVWGGERLILHWGWWTSRVVNVWVVNILQSFTIVGPGTLNIKCFFVFQGGWKIQNLWNSGFCFCGFLRWLTNTPLGRHFLPSAWDIIYTPCFASSWFSYNTLPYFLSLIDLISLLQEVTVLYSERI